MPRISGTPKRMERKERLVATSATHWLVAAPAALKAASPSIGHKSLLWPKIRDRPPGGLFWIRSIHTDRPSFFLLTLKAPCRRAVSREAMRLDHPRHVSQE